MIALPALCNKPIARAVLAASRGMMGWRSAGAPALAIKSIEAIGVDRSWETVRLSLAAVVALR